jgi:hypothetical protein
MSFKKLAFGAVAGGLTAGVLDLFAAMVTYEVPMPVVMKSIASGVLGRAAFDGGAGAAALGTGLHLFIAVVAAGLYAAAARSFPPIARRPVVFGPLFGIGVFAVMNYLVVPLSASPLRPPEGAMIVKGLLVHMLVVGLPIALIVSRSLRETAKR